MTLLYAVISKLILCLKWSWESFIIGLFEAFYHNDASGDDLWASTTLFSKASPVVLFAEILSISFKVPVRECRVTNAAPSYGEKTESDASAAGDLLH